MNDPGRSIPNPELLPGTTAPAPQPITPNRPFANIEQTSPPLNRRPRPVSVPLHRAIEIQPADMQITGPEEPDPGKSPLPAPPERAGPDPDEGKAVSTPANTVPGSREDRLAGSKEDPAPETIIVDPPLSPEVQQERAGAIMSKTSYQRYKPLTRNRGRNISTSGAVTADGSLSAQARWD